MEVSADHKYLKIKSNDELLKEIEEHRGVYQDAVKEAILRGIDASVYDNPSSYAGEIKLYIVYEDNEYYAAYTSKKEAVDALTYLLEIQDKASILIKEERVVIK